MPSLKTGVHVKELVGGETKKPAMLGLVKLKLVMDVILTRVGEMIRTTGTGVR